MRTRTCNLKQEQYQLAERTRSSNIRNKNPPENLHFVTNWPEILEAAQFELLQSSRYARTDSLPTYFLPRDWKHFTTKNMMIYDGEESFPENPFRGHVIPWRKAKNRSFTGAAWAPTFNRKFYWYHDPAIWSEVDLLECILTKNQLLCALRLHINSWKTRAVQAFASFSCLFFGMAIWSQKQLQFNRPRLKTVWDGRQEFLHRFTTKKNRWSQTGVGSWSCE